MVDNAKGALFKNNKKTKPNQPDYTGNFMLTVALAEALLAEAKSAGADGAKVQLASWIKTSPKGNFLSVSVSAPYKKDGASSSRSTSMGDLDDDMPF